jgi:hypothetical protein
LPRPRRATRKGFSVIFGPGSDKVLQSGDKVADKEARERFVKAADEANALEKSGDAKAILTVGKDKWPFPVPIVKAESGWRFDVEAGKRKFSTAASGARALHRAVGAGLRRRAARLLHAQSG